MVPAVLLLPGIQPRGPKDTHIFPQKQSLKTLKGPDGPVPVSISSAPSMLPLGTETMCILQAPASIHSPFSYINSYGKKNASLSIEPLPITFSSILGCDTYFPPLCCRQAPLLFPFVGAGFAIAGPRAAPLLARSCRALDGSWSSSCLAPRYGAHHQGCLSLRHSSAERFPTQAVPPRP